MLPMYKEATQHGVQQAHTLLIKLITVVGQQADSPVARLNFAAHPQVFTAPVVGVSTARNEKKLRVKVRQPQRSLNLEII